MLQPHSLLWHYLWIGPNILQAVLAFLLWRRGLHRRFPVFFAYLIFGAIQECILYVMDVVPLGSERAWWLAFTVSLVIEGTLRLAVTGELFFHQLRSRPTVAKVGGRLITSVGALLVLLATVAVAYAPVDSHQFALGYRAHLLQQTLYMIECGLILFVFAFLAAFKLSWDRANFGIGLGRGISASVHLGTWALMANAGLAQSRYLLDFLNMATYHICVLIWFYYLLVPQKSATTSAVPLPENNLDIWNRELERLLQQ
jgi:hypothetical protein